MDTKQQPPIITSRYGQFSVSVFAREMNDRNGNSFTAYNFTLQKSYQDQEGHWQRQTVNADDRQVLMLAELAKDAFVRLAHYRQQKTADAFVPASTTQASAPPAGQDSLDDEVPF
jgi:hypothetical protein